MEKVWNSAPSETEDWAVNVQLYRTTNPENMATDDAHKVKDGLVTLTKADGWKHIFTGLDQYDDEGKEYTYYAREVSIDPTPDNSTDDVATLSNGTISAGDCEFTVTHEEPDGE